MNTVNVLGLDSGFVRLGFGSLRDGKLFRYGLICHPNDGTLEFNNYLDSGIHQIVDMFPRLLSMVEPDLVVGETVPVGKLGSSDSTVVAGITTCKVITYQWGIPWMNIAASTVKKRVTGNGRATKAQVRNALISMYPALGDHHKQMKQQQKEAGVTVKGLEDDVFDGIAVAIAGSQLYAETRRPEDNPAEEVTSTAP